jgi:inorganic phosphate transporter, PiT family
MDWMLLAVVVTALIFDFTNGFHDAANAIATSVSTRALPMNLALILAALLNVVGGMLSTVVAATMATGIVMPEVVTLAIVLAGLLGAIFWNLLTWYFGIPSSSSHCLIGGITGAVCVAHGLDGVHWGGILFKVVIPTVVSPLLGFAAGVALTCAIAWVFRSAQPGRTNLMFKRAQLL